MCMNYKTLLDNVNKDLNEWRAWHVPGCQLSSN